LLARLPHRGRGRLPAVPPQPRGHAVVLQRTREDVPGSTAGRLGRRAGTSRSRPQPGG
jgi:hypothetical protein